MMECHRKLGQPAEALAVCREGRRFYPDDAQLLLQEALLRRDQGDDAGKEACLLRLLGSNDGPHFASVAEGLRGYKARHELAVHYHQKGRHAEAEGQWQAALRERPDFAPAWLGLGEGYISQGQWASLEDLIRRLEEADPAHSVVPGVVLRTRACLARRESEAARRLVEEALVQAPQEALLWVLLSHALLQQGQDGAAAERALQRVLELDPANEEARRNLACLCRDRSQRMTG